MAKSMVIATEIWMKGDYCVVQQFFPHGCSKMCSPLNAYFWTLGLLLKVLWVPLLSSMKVSYLLELCMMIIRVLLGSQTASQSVCSFWSVLQLRFQSPGYNVFLSWAAHLPSTTHFLPAHSTSSNSFISFLYCFW